MIKKYFCADHRYPAESWMGGVKSLGASITIKDVIR
jgi:hypothetical protein